MSDSLNPLESEARLARGWAERGIGARLLEKNAGAEPFVLVDGPSEVAGPVPLDAALGRLLTDIAAKFRNLSGRPCRVVPGWSTHGRALEQAVAQRLQAEGVDPGALSREDFQARCRAQALEGIRLQTAAYQRMGVFADWEAPYRTMDPAAAAQELRELATLARRGLLSRRRRWAYGCAHCQTVLSEEEVEDVPRQSPSLYVAFRAGPELAGRMPMLEGREVFFLGWTAAPWTLPVHETLSVHADFEYVFYQLGERVICAARPLLAKVLAEVKGDELVKKTARLRGGDVETVGFEDFRRILAYASGEDLQHLTYQHPWLERTGRVVLSPHVTDEAGTGLVPTAPAAGEDGEGRPSPVGLDGRYDGSVGAALQGQKVFEADARIVDLLEERGALLNAKTDTVEHPAPRCRTCHQPAFLLTRPQWVLSMDRAPEGHPSLRARALEAVDRVQWMPEEGLGRLRRGLEGQKDWGLGQPRRWGVPLPVAFCEGCGEAIASPEVMERVASAVAQEGVEVWFRSPVETFLGAGVRCAGCGGSTFRRETELLDAGFDAACMLPAVLARHPRGPADLCVARSDSRGEAFRRSWLVWAGTRGQVPSRACFTHGAVSAPDGTLPVERILQAYGAEVLRLWAATHSYHAEVPLSDSLLEGLRQDAAKVREALHRALSHLEGFEPGGAPDAVLPQEARLREWLAEGVTQIRQAYEQGAFHLVIETVGAFCEDSLSAASLEALREPLSQEGPARRSAQAMLYAVVSTLVRLLAPVLSFTAEAVWQALPGPRAESVFLAGFPEPAVAPEPAP
ncbi:Isoleucyl-tRNA synthetase [Stigmatella aurantiaca]|uniref:isoleucine--tRNA ligase n=1 Tax=Stigmatella aurantiaca TaxID=41 RepID=A0A1H8AXA1_STIAU|nr:class I tRNA ligase family protein [Stigmatella aurantiaca]SEM75370.1 Isoleucyl-tRNA synthetase [Stigmatella aurantiaca]